MLDGRCSRRTSTRPGEVRRRMNCLYQRDQQYPASQYQQQQGKNGSGGPRCGLTFRLFFKIGECLPRHLRLADNAGRYFVGDRAGRGSSLRSCMPFIHERNAAVVTDLATAFLLQTALGAIRHDNRSRYLKCLLNRHRLRQVPGLVYVASPELRYVVGKEL